jgi:nucleotide-binding universal stress UspA family protein
VSRIIIGVDGSERSEDAVAFGRMLAQASGAPVTVVGAYPHEPDAPPSTSIEQGEALREEAETALVRMSEPLRDLRGLETRSVADRSPARALQDVATEQNAGVIVIGSSHTGRAGRVLPGSTAERLLHGSPCPVAVVSLGFRSSESPRPRVIGCAWDGRPESDAALGAAEDLARGFSATLRVIRVLESEQRIYPSELGGRYQQVIDTTRETARSALERRVTHLTERVRGEGALQEGDAAHELIGATELVDLMVIGSRGYGPLRGAPRRRLRHSHPFGELPSHRHPQRRAVDARVRVHRGRRRVTARCAAAGVRGRPWATLVQRGVEVVASSQADRCPITPPQLMTCQDEGGPLLLLIRESYALSVYRAPARIPSTAGWLDCRARVRCCARNRRTNHHNIHVRGYKEEGTTTMSFDNVMLDDLDRYHLVIDVIDRVPGLGQRAAGLRQATVDERWRHRAYTREVGDDRPDGRDWNWSGGDDVSPRRRALRGRGASPEGWVLVVNAASSGLRLGLLDHADVARAERELAAPRREFRGASCGTGAPLRSNTRAPCCS